jgi:hypothetical protein
VLADAYGVDLERAFATTMDELEAKLPIAEVRRMSRNT